MATKAISRLPISAPFIFLLEKFVIEPVDTTPLKGSRKPESKKIRQQGKLNKTRTIYKQPTQKKAWNQSSS